MGVPFGNVQSRVRKPYQELLWAAAGPSVPRLGHICIYICGRKGGMGMGSGLGGKKCHVGSPFE